MVNWALRWKVFLVELLLCDCAQRCGRLLSSVCVMKFYFCVNSLISFISVKEQTICCNVTIQIKSIKNISTLTPFILLLYFPFFSFNSHGVG